MRYLVWLLMGVSPLALGEEKTPPLGYSHLAAGPGYLEAAASLLLVLAMIFGLAWVARRFGLSPVTKGNAVRIIGGVSLGSRERAVLLEVEGQRVLVGVAPGQVTPLLTLDGGASASEISDFAQKLQEAKEGETHKTAAEEEDKS